MRRHPLDVVSELRGRHPTRSAARDDQPRPIAELGTVLLGDADEFSDHRYQNRRRKIGNTIGHLPRRQTIQQPLDDVGCAQ